MDAEGYRRCTENICYVSQTSGELDQRVREAEGWRLVHVFLSGGAPWGFTLRGGLEHREPLLITKVEEGSKAAAMCLQVGDELVNINEVPLSGYRQEAICLVKGSHRTLSLVVKRNLKMVDIVAQKMPSENDVHVARSFLTKILRSSMRRNEPLSRPHSWHSTKFNESQSEHGKRRSPPTAVWHNRYDASASSSTTDLSTGWEQTNLRRVSDQFSSLGSMDSLEHVPHLYHSGQLSSAKSNNSMEHLGGGKRDSAYSSFSTTSSTPDYSLSRSNAASTENMACKVGQWDTGVKQNHVRNSQSLAADGGKQDDRVTYFQMPGVLSGHSVAPTDEMAGTRHSSSSRTVFGPVWNVPEKKKFNSQSPPPPPPPTRSDSFAATKAHERGRVGSHPEGSDSHSVSKGSTECHHISLKNDGENSHSFSDKSNLKFSSNKQYSISNSDVPHGQVPHVSQSFHPRQHNDKSTFHSQSWTTSAPKPQNIGSSSVTLRELQTNGSTQTQNQRRSFSTGNFDQHSESATNSRYYCVASGQQVQSNPQSLSDIPEDRTSSVSVEPAQTENEQISFSPQIVTKVKYQTPKQQLHSSQSKEGNGYNRPKKTAVLESSVFKPDSDDGVVHRGPITHTVESHHCSNPAKRQPEQQRALPTPVRETPVDTGAHNLTANNICPRATPILHSLSKNMPSQEEANRDADSEESLEVKQVKRSERFATTLRNEIQLRRARLQKSKSAAAIPVGEHETEEDQDQWKAPETAAPPSAEGSFSHSYKDHLKEAQARVLKATSFMRKDLEPVLSEHSAGEAHPNHSTQARKDVLPLPTLSESVVGISGLSSGQVTRIGSRKRFPTEKKVRSVSEPDKIHKYGVDENASLTEHESSSSSPQRVLKEKTGKSNFNNYGRHNEHTKKDVKNDEVPCAAMSPLDQQRLGTFAEYEAKWNTKTKYPEKRPSSRYHSAENILDRGEDGIKSTCLHERSRSSPSADIYGQNTSAPAAKCASGYFQTESKSVKPSADIRFSDRGPGDCAAEEKLDETESSSAPPPPPMTGANPDCRQRAAAATKNHKPTSSSHSLTEPASPQPDDHSHTQPPSGLEAKTDAASHETFRDSEPVSTFHPCSSAKADCGQGKVHHLPPSSPQRASSPPASSHRPSGMEGQRSPSPQFSPQRLSDKPPVSPGDEASSRMEGLIESQSTSVRKVPIRIVHSEGAEEKENSPFLPHNDLPPSRSEGHGVVGLDGLGALGKDSVFCAFARQREPDAAPEVRPHLTPHGDVYMTTVGHQCGSEEQPPERPTEEPGSQWEASSRTVEEDQKREELARDIMGKDKSLVEILDQSKMKTTMDLMEGIFPQGEQLLEGAHQRRKVQAKPANARPVEDRGKEDGLAAAVAMVTSSTYYSTSAPKAELLIKMKDMQEQHEEEDSEDELDVDLANKKQELIDSLSKKLQVLREARESLLEDILENNSLGHEVEVQVQQVCRPNELEKFRMFVGDLDKVVSLLLSLSGRLARVENALNSLEEDATPEERRTLIEKRKLLVRQHEDAKELKENLDRREGVVYEILSTYLPEDSLTDYEHFVKMKSALIIEQRKLEDKIKLGEEQLKCLIDSLPLEQRLAV